MTTVTVTFSYKVEWRPTPNSLNAVSLEVPIPTCPNDPDCVRGDIAELAAISKVNAAAVRRGYRAPRWWEYWRWFESPMRLGLEERP